MGAFLRKYATATHIYVPLIKRGVVDFAVSADFTPASGDVKVSIDGGAAANIGTLPTAVTMGNTALWDFTIASGEVTGKKITITVADSATKAVEDQCFIIETYGHASAEYPVDLSASVLPVNVTHFGGSAGTFASGKPDVGAATSVSGAVGSVTGAVGSVTGNVGGNVNGNVVGSVASVTGNVGGNVSGNVSGSVGSVAGAVGSVTGSVGSVVGNVGGSVASVAGAVGSVTGNVGGDVSGKVLGGGSGTISGDGVRAASVTGAVGSVTGSVGSVVGAVVLDSAIQTQVNNIENASGYLLAVLAGACADPQTASETYAITVFGSTFTVDMAGQTSTGARTAPTLTKT